MADDQMDEESRKLVDQLREIDPSSPRPNRAAKPLGEGRFKIPTLVRPREIAKQTTEDGTPNSLGKRKRVGSSPGGIEGGSSSGRGRDKGRAIDMGDDAIAEGDGEDERSRMKVGKMKRKPQQPEPTEDPKISSPPNACRPRLIKRDDDVTITEGGPEMDFGDAPRYYAKIVREIEDWDPKDRQATPEALEEDYRMPDHPPVILALVDWSLLHMTDCTQKFSDRELVTFAMGPDVLPLLKQWAYMWLNPDDDSKAFLKKMRRTFPADGEDGKPWKNIVRRVGEHAARQINFEYKTAPLLHTMSSFSRRLVRGNETFFEAFGEHEKATDEPYKFAARLLLVVWEDLEADRNGFFGVLLKSELARAHRPEVRRAYEGWYVVDERQYQ